MARPPAVGNIAVTVQQSFDAAQSRRRVEDRLRVALVAGRMAAWEWDPATDIVTPPDALTAIFGTAGADATKGADYSALIHPEDRESHRAIVQAALRGGGSWHDEFRVIRPSDGEVAWMEDRAQVLRDPATGREVVVGVVWDITARRRAEEALVRARQELEERVIARTRELAQSNDSLREQIAERRRAEEARQTLLRQLVNAQEAERRRIARELHDELGQKLSALTLKLAMMRQDPAIPEEARRQVEGLEKLARQADGDLDFLVWQLRPTALDDLGLVAALRDHMADWSRHYGIACEFLSPTSGDMRLDPEIETVLYRVAQEALNNVAKHARARRVEVRLERSASHASLTVEDDGIGFDARASREGAKGLGLLGMRERASFIGGEVQVRTKPGGGTRVKVDVPLPTAA